MCCLLPLLGITSSEQVGATSTSPSASWAGLLLLRLCLLRRRRLRPCLDIIFKFCFRIINCIFWDQQLCLRVLQRHRLCHRHCRRHFLHRYLPLCRPSCRLLHRHRVLHLPLLGIFSIYKFVSCFFIFGLFFFSFFVFGCFFYCFIFLGLIGSLLFYFVVFFFIFFGRFCSCFFLVFCFIFCFFFYFVFCFVFSSLGLGYLGIIIF